MGFVVVVSAAGSLGLAGEAGFGGGACASLLLFGGGATTGLRLGGGVLGFNFGASWLVAALDAMPKLGLAAPTASRPGVGDGRLAGTVGVGDGAFRLDPGEAAATMSATRRAIAGDRGGTTTDFGLPGLGGPGRSPAGAAPLGPTAGLADRGSPDGGRPGLMGTESTRGREGAEASLSGDPIDGGRLGRAEGLAGRSMLLRRSPLAGTALRMTTDGVLASAEASCSAG